MSRPKQGKQPNVILVQESKQPVQMVKPARNQQSKTKRIRIRQANGKVATITGQGPYKFTDISSIFPMVGAGVGALGGPMGAITGATVGTAVDKLANYISGTGRYKVTQNTLVNPGAPLPSFKSLSEATRVRHREMVCQVVEPANNAGAFINRNFYLNPALPCIGFSGAGFLPWGSSLACSYQQYRIMGMVFQFVTRSSPINNSASGGLGLGLCCMATNYDVLSRPYASMMEAENSQYAVPFNPAVPQLHEIECEPNVTSISTLYTRESAVPTGADQRLYDHGLFQFLTQGLPASTTDQTIGEIWCTYDIALVKPVMQAGISGQCVLSWKWRLPIATVAAAGVAYLGNPASAAVLASGSAINAPTLSNAGVITFPAGTTGKWMLQYTVNGTAATITNGMVVTAGANITSLLLFNSDAQATNMTATGVASNTVMLTYTFAFTNPAQSGNTIALSNGTLPTAITGADLWISQVNSGIST